MKKITVLLMIVGFHLQAAQKEREIKSSYEDRGWTIITGDGEVLENDFFDNELPASKKKKPKKRRSQKLWEENVEKPVKFFIGEGDQELQSLPASPERLPKKLAEEIFETEGSSENIEDNRSLGNSSPSRPLPRVNTSSESLVDLCVEVDEFARKVGGWFLTAGQDIWGAVKQGLFEE